MIINTQTKRFGSFILIPRWLFFTMKAVSKEAQLRGDYHIIKMLCPQFSETFVTILYFDLFVFALHEYNCFMPVIMERNMYYYQYKPILCLYTN